MSEVLLAHSPLEGSAAYVGGSSASSGRSGGFVPRHTATVSGAGASASWTVVPDTGTGELFGISGVGAIINEPDGGHTLTLDYELG